MKICIIGTGSLGSAIGGTLAENGHEVTFVNNQNAHVEAIQRNGLRLVKKLNGDPGRIIKVKVQNNYDGIQTQDLCIVLVKSFCTREAVQRAKESNAIGPQTVVLTLQNGLGNEETIQEVVGSENVIGGKTFVSGFLSEPGTVMATTAALTYIGEMNGNISERIKWIGEELTLGGIKTIVSDNIRGVIWDKLLVNVATGAISGATGLSYGGLYEKYGLGAIPEVKAAAIAAITEAIQVAKAYGVRLSSEDPEYPWFHAAEGQPDSFKASILQSLMKKQVSEIDYINGAVARWGKKVGIDTPVNDTLTAIIKGIEYRQARENK